MEELIKALTRAANAVAEYYEKASAPLLPLARTSVVEKYRDVKAEAPAGPAAGIEKPRKTRAPKAEAPAPKAETADPTDLIGSDDLPPALKPAQGQMTEKESETAVKEAARALIQRFAAPRGDRPEGFHIAMEILADKFKTTRLTDLTHPQRLAFIQEAKRRIAEADKLSPVGV